jgi:endonuclease/exonuclease/phosphatase family metal-dependent hydrolase
MPMRLLSYNIHKGIGGGDRFYRLERVIRVIEDEKPDLICLQEVSHNTRRTRFDDQARLLAKHFNPAAHLYQQNVHWRSGGGYGNLILSRWPLRSKNHLCLRLGRKKPRGAQLAVVSTPEGPLHLVNWHLGLREPERRWQAGHLLGHALFQEFGHLPTLVTGDFNDWRNTLAAGPFARHTFAQLTGPPKQYRSFPALLPMLSIDKAFARGGVAVRHARVVRTPLARRASDHLPLVIDFHLDPAGVHGRTNPEKDHPRLS